MYNKNIRKDSRMDCRMMNDYKMLIVCCVILNQHQTYIPKPLSHNDSSAVNMLYIIIIINRE